MSASPTTPFGQISFPHLFTARAPSPNADPRFSLSLLVDKEGQNSPEYKAMKQAAMDAAKQKWGDKAVDMMRNGQIRMPFRDASEKSKYDGYEDGKIFINLWTNKAPGVIDGALRDVEEKDVYPGMIGRCTYNAFAYDNSGNKGVSFGLNNVQITDFTAPRLDGRVAANKDFDATDMAVADMDGSDQTSGGISGDNEDADFPF